MNAFQYILSLIAILLAMIFAFEWREVKKAEAGPAQLIHDINDHAYGGMPRADLEPYLVRRGGDVTYDPTPGMGHTSGADHVLFRNIRHLGDARENLKADFYYDATDHLTYFVMRRYWEHPKK